MSGKCLYYTHVYVIYANLDADDKHQLRTEIVILIDKQYSSQIFQNIKQITQKLQNV